MLPRRRKIAIVVSVAVGVPLVAFIATWSFWLPGIVRERAEAAASARLGMQCVIGDVSLRTRGAVLQDVVLTGRHGGLRVEIAEVGVKAGVWDLLSDGASAIERVQARDVDAELNLTAAGARESLRAVVSALSTASSGGSPGVAAPGRIYDAIDVAVRVVDAEGELVRTRAATLVKDGDRITFWAEQVDVGGAPGDTAELHDAWAAVRRSEGSLRIEQLRLGGGQLVWASRGGDEDRGNDVTFRRLRNVAAALRGSEEEPEPQSAGTGTGSGTGTGTGTGRLPALLAVFTPNFSLDLEGVTIKSRTDAGDQLVLRGLRGRIEGEGDDRFHADGSGVTADGGRVSWDMRVAPRDMHAEGSLRFAELPLAVVVPFLPEVPWYQPEDARLSGELVLRGRSQERLAVRGRVELAGAALYSDRIAAYPVRGIELAVEGTGYWYGARRRLELDSGRVRMGRAEAHVSGAMEWAPDHYLFDVTATLPPTPCGTAIGAIPEDLLGEFAGFSFAGTIGARTRLRVDSRDLQSTELDLHFADACEFVTVPPIADLNRVRGPFLHRVMEPDGTVFEMTTGPGTGTWSSIYGISPFVVQAVLTHEDASFFRHGGFAPWAIRDALVRNLERGRFVVGASTITMQLAKNLFLNREKTLARKVQEVILTWYLEHALEKRDILELYLNIIEYGPGVYGLRHAARRYFGRSPGELSAAEACWIAAILPAPRVYHAQYQDGAPSPSMMAKIRRMLGRMRSAGRIDEEAYRQALEELGSPGFFRFPGEGRRPPRDLRGRTASLPFAGGEPQPMDEWQGDDGDEGYDPWAVPDGDGSYDDWAPETEY